jgi:hypothetical protein
VLLFFLRVLLAMLIVVFAILLWASRVVVLIYMESRWPVLD